MVKTRKNKSSIINTITKTSEETLPVLDKNITKVGVTAKEITEKSIPVVEKGVSAVYGTMATGLDLGVKGAKTLAKGMSKGRRGKHRSVSRSRSLAGGRRTRRRRH